MTFVDDPHTTKTTTTTTTTTTNFRAFEAFAEEAQAAGVEDRSRSNPRNQMLFWKNTSLWHELEPVNPLNHIPFNS